MTCAFAVAMLLGAQCVQAQNVVDGQTAKELAEKAKIAKAADKAQAAVVKAEKKVESAKKAIEKEGDGAGSVGSAPAMEVNGIVWSGRAKLLEDVFVDGQGASAALVPHLIVTRTSRILDEGDIIA